MVLVDIIARYKKSQGYQIYFQTGSDEHGEKIEKKAKSLGISPQELVDKNVLLFKQLWKELGISEHIFYRTSSCSHKEKVQKTFTELLNKGDIYLGKYQGKYCIACEDYVSEGKVIDSNLCPTPNCQTELRKVNEPAYFLKVNKYYPKLLKFYSQNPNFLLPANIKKELFENFLKNDIRDLCITRSDIKWGIPVPDKEKMVIYVWFEALLNYLNSEPGARFFTSDSPNEKINDKVREFSCVAIQNKNSEYLLVYNKKYGKWQIPGGKLEPNESPLQAAKREIFEETNLIVENLEKFGEKIFNVANVWWKAHFYRTNNYFGELLVKEPQTISEIKFFEVSEIEKLNSQIPDEVTEYLLKKITVGEIIHLVGKEITRFHAIYWPIILFSLNKNLPSKILAHGWLTTPQGKMSKSKGNVIDPLELLKKYPSDLLRAYFVAKINFLQDGVCDEDLLKEFYQDFLVNNLSNLASRTNKMLYLYNEGIIPEFTSKKKDLRLENYYKMCILAVSNFQEMMDKYELTNAFSQIQGLLNKSNRIIQEMAPWELTEKGEKLLLNLTLNYLSNGIKIIAFLLNCIIPETSKEILAAFNIDYEKLNWNNLLDFNLLSKIKTKPLKKHLYTKL